MQANQHAAQIAAEHKIFSQMAPYMSCIFLVLVGIDPGVSRLGGEIASHNTTDARQKMKLHEKSKVDRQVHAGSECRY